MSPRTLRHPALVVGVVSALVAGPVAPAALAAGAPPSPAVAQRGLFDGIADLTPSLVDVLTTLTTNPTAVLSPATIQTVLDGLVGLADGAAADVLELLAPETVAGLLGGVLGTVTELAQGATGTATPATAEVEAALGELQALLVGGPPTTQEGIDALTSILGHVSTLLGLPEILALPVVDDLVLTLKALGGSLPAPLADAVTGVLDAVAGPTPAGVDPVLAAALGLLGLAAGRTPAPATSPPGSATPAAGPTTTKVPRARIASVRLNRARTRVTVRIACPASAPAAGCRVITSVKLRGKAAKVSRRVTVRRGATRTLKAKVPAALAKRVRRSGGRVLVRVGTSGSGSGAVAKTVRVRRAAR
jgi:hypothetical protein